LELQFLGLLSRDCKGIGALGLPYVHVSNALHQERANRLITAGTVDSVAFAPPYIVNPDLPERFLTSAPLSEINWPTVYASDQRDTSIIPDC
jgi:N-ethylmaleimide reductase